MEGNETLYTRYGRQRQLHSKSVFVCLLVATFSLRLRGNVAFGEYAPEREEQPIDKLLVTGETCAFGKERGRVGNVNESFVYIDGAGLPTDGSVVNFAGVFDLSNRLEVDVFRGNKL